MSSNTILVFSEKPALLRQLLGKARQQADSSGWIVAALDLGKEGVALGEAGADIVYQMVADEKNPEAVLAALAAAASQAQAGIVLIGATKLGMEIAPRLAERLRAGYAAWVVGFDVEPAVQLITTQCMVYTGTGLATYHFKSGVVVLTAAQGVFETSSTPGKVARLEILDAPATTSRITILEYKAKPTSGARLEEAKLVVDIGQGIKERDDLQIAQTLASLLDGQLACSRPIASDRDWFPEWLGLSGAKIKPELCITVGVSGAIQHIVGIRESHLIVAINIDENAPIFSQADYGIVADLYTFLPAFIDRIQSRAVRPAWKS